MNGPFDRKRIPSIPREPRRGLATDPVSPPVGRAQGTSTVSRPEEDDARSSSKYRAALEALFAPKQAAPPSEPPPADRPSKKMVIVPSREDPRGPERERRLAKLLGAEGRAAVTKAAEDFARAGFDFPMEQEVLLKLLDHRRDDRVRAALEGIGRLLEEEPPQRRTLLEARLRRLEDDADDADVRDLASSVLKRLLLRPGR
ncbi:MAG: hypothetical protein ACLQVI_11090 [Polyangiaceae bacterium]|jgi:hypothetical protein